MEKALLDAQDDKASVPEDSSSSNFRGHLPACGPSTRTGPKGVLADYEEAQSLAKERRELENERARQMIERLAFTADPTAHPDPPAKEGEASDEDSELEDADLQEILRRRREQQLLRLKAASGRPHFERVEALDRDDYVAAIDREQPSVFVVIHIFEHDIPACRRLNTCIDHLAAEFNHVKFCKIARDEASSAIDYVALPALLVYRGGELQGSYMRITDELGHAFDQDDVRILLSSAGGRCPSSCEVVYPSLLCRSGALEA